MFKKYNYFEIVWFTVFTIINIIVWYNNKDSGLALLASMSGIIFILLVAKGEIINYPFGVINCILYGYIAWQSAYYGETMLNWGFYFPINFIGWFMWKKHLDKKSSIVTIRVMSLKLYAIYLVAMSISTLVYGMWLVSLNNTLPYVDSFTVVASIASTILMIQRYLELWVLWILINACSVYMWVYVKNDPNITVMWSAYLINSIYGLYLWIKIYQEQQAQKEALA